MAIENKEINVEGMHCPSCKLAVEMSLKDLDGVEDAVADFETGPFFQLYLTFFIPFQPFLGN